MGITNLMRVIETLCPDAISTLHRDTSIYHHVYYDVNNVIYQLLGGSEESFYLRLYRDIDNTVRLTKPKQSLFLAVDGPGPRAKVATQLSRRQKVDLVPNKDLQRLAFTPGTRFMQRLRSALNVYAASRVAQSRNRGLSVWVSGSDCAGEGENKCFNHMRRLPATHRCLVVGTDSDLIAYTLRANCIVHILRGQDKVVKGDIMKASLAHGITVENNLDDQSRIADDFVFLSIMNGNDYLPGLAYYDFQVMWQLYRKVKLENAALRKMFVFDAATKKVNWKFLALINSLSGADKVETRQKQKLYQNDVGNLNPRAMINQILQLGQDLAVFEVVKGAPQGDGVVVRVFSMHPEGKHFWEAFGKGKTQREASLDACLNALRPGSQFLAHFENNRRYPIEKLKKVANMLKALQQGSNDILKWIQSNNLLSHPIEKVQVGGISVEPDADRPYRSDLDYTQREVPDEELYTRYLEGLVWNFDYYSGTCKDYGYFYPFRDSVTLRRLCELAPSLPDSSSKGMPPLAPLVLGLCLLPGKARTLLPEPFGSLELEKHPQLGKIFEYNSELLATNREMMSEYLDEVEEFVRQFSETERARLTDEAQHLLQLHQPTAYMDRENPLLKTFPRGDLDAYNFIPPNMPSGMKVLTDAPASSRIVAGTNLVRPVMGQWFHLGHPHKIQTRSFSNLAGARSLFKRFLRK